MVGANTFREPALTAKMATTLDHISGGRAILGIGGAWFETEHEAYGLAFGERLPGAAALARRGAPDHARHAPRRAARRQPARATRPGRSATTRRPSRSACRSSSAVAASRSRSSWSPGTATPTTSAAASRTSSARRRSSCSTARRSVATRRRSSARPVSGRSSSATRARRPSGSTRPCSRPTATPISGRTSRSGRRRMSPSDSPPFVEIGYRHLIAGFPSPHDEESMTRLATEVRPLLQRG